MRRWPMVLVLAVSVLACGFGSGRPMPLSAQGDKQRLAELMADPVLHGLGPVRGLAGGWIRETKRWGRTWVSAELFDSTAGATMKPEAVRQTVAATMKRLRAAGWTVVYVSCEPTADEVGRWEWDVRAYRIVDRVSRLAMVTAAGPGTNVRIPAYGQIELDAPTAGLDPDNVLRQRPPGPVSGVTCAEKPLAATTQRTVLGTPIGLAHETGKQVGPTKSTAPGPTRSPTPHAS